MPITLSRRQIKTADRMTGAELLLPWPASLGDLPELERECERDATDAEREWVQQHVQPACVDAGLIAGRTTACNVYGPTMPRTDSHKWGVRLSVIIIGQRWVGNLAHVTHRPQLWYLSEMPS